MAEYGWVGEEVCDSEIQIGSGLRALRCRPTRTLHARLTPMCGVAVINGEGGRGVSSGFDAEYPGT